MRNDPAAAIGELKARFGSRVETGEAVCRAHANTLTWIAAEPPDAVVWPLKTDEVVAIVDIAARHRVPLIPFGRVRRSKDMSTRHSAGYRSISAA